MIHCPTCGELNAHTRKTCFRCRADRHKADRLTVYGIISLIVCFVLLLVLMLVL